MDDGDARRALRATISVIEGESTVLEKVVETETTADFLKASDSSGPLAETLRQLASVYKQTNALLTDIIVQQTGLSPRSVFLPVLPSLTVASSCL